MTINNNDYINRQKIKHSNYCYYAFSCSKVYVVIGIIFLLFIYFFGKDLYLSIMAPIKVEKQLNPIIIDLNSDPIYKGKVELKSFFINDNNGESVKIIPVGEYEISGKIKDWYNYPGGGLKCPYKGLPSISAVFVWGKFAEEKYYKGLDVSLFRDSFSFIINDNDISNEIGLDYLKTHTSVNDLVPANKNIKNAIKRLEKDDKIKVKGYLINIYYPGVNDNFKTSYGPNDFGTYSGNIGGNEIIYVTELITENGIYK